MNKITERKYWQNYWDKFNPAFIDKIFFEEFLWLLSRNCSFIEIGGFPGNIAGYLKNKLNLEVTILDYVIFPKVINDVEKMYNLPNNSIKIVEGDLFNVNLNQKYEIVASFGFIEHFEDTGDIIRRHLELLESGGMFFGTIPNFKGVNGYVQKFFHPENYYKHNINSMNLKTLENILEKMELNNIFVSYFGSPEIWFEKDARIGKLKKKLFYYFAKILRRIPFQKNFLLASNIIMVGIKK